MAVESWGRYPKIKQRSRALQWRTDPLPPDEDSMLPHGMGRSYGDSCLNEDGVVLVTTGLDNLMAFDPTTGVLRAEAGITIEEILRVCVPKGWFVPVTPGTKFVTLGGAIANDVHGKNHHAAGCFGNHVRSFELLRSDGERMLCSPEQRADYFGATIGGMGLTGLITWAEIQMLKINNEWIEHESIKLKDLDDFFAINQESQSYHYTVAWIDSVKSGRSLGRGHYWRSEHARDGIEKQGRFAPKAAVPFTFPSGTLNRLTISAFNAVYYNRQFRRHVHNIQHYEPFFYPLDAIHAWNRIYGNRGLIQYQCVVPHDGARESISDLIRGFADDTGSFLTVLKAFGDIPSPGLMSFPRPGITLNLDFPMEGQRTLDLCDRLDDIVKAAGGALYPAKDARMSPEMFRLSHPQWEQFLAYVDPKFSSSFFRRVTADKSQIMAAPAHAMRVSEQVQP